MKFLICLFSLFMVTVASAQTQIQVASNVYMASSPTSKDYFSNLKKITAVLQEKQFPKELGELSFNGATVTDEAVHYHFVAPLHDERFYCSFNLYFLVKHGSTQVSSPSVQKYCQDRHED